MRVRTLADLRNDGAPNSRPMPGSVNQRILVANPGNIFPDISKLLTPNSDIKTLSFFITITCTVIFFIELGFSWAKFETPFSKAEPGLGPDDQILQIMGANSFSKYKESKLEIWRLFASSWIHASVLHIFSNLLFLTLLGYNYEDKWGTLYYGIIYLATGLGASLFSCINENSSAVGASGSLCGLLGAQLAFVLLNWGVTSTQDCCNIILFSIFVVFMSSTQNELSNTERIDLLGHIGGWLTGLLLGLAWPVSKIEPISCLFPDYMKYVFAFLLICFYTGLLLHIFI